MRQVVLDTETTGLESESGHRIIEIGALELIDRRLTGRRFHVYLNPERTVEGRALELHGLTDEFLSDKPRFPEVADEFLAFIDQSELVIHNASFDVAFLDSELERLGERKVRIADLAQVLDSLELARELHPGQRNTLDALCRRYEIDNSNRTLHGALLDAELLTEVYLAMTGGQVALGLELDADGSESGARQAVAVDPGRLRVFYPEPNEIAAHRARLDAIAEASGAEGCLWLDFEEESG